MMDAGMWDTAAPITTELKEGKNVLRLEHQTDGCAKGFSIHHYSSRRCEVLARTLAAESR
jgi:hypothetical protein